MSETAAACRAIEEDLSALLDGELDAPREAELRAHLTSCSSCTQRIAELDSVDAILRGMAQAVAPADAARQDRVRRGIRDRARADAAATPASEARPFARPAAPRRPRAAKLLIAASIAAGLAGLVFLVEQPSSILPESMVATPMPDTQRATAPTSDGIAAAKERVAAQQGPDAFAAGGASALTDVPQQDSGSLENASDEELELAAALAEMERGQTSVAAPALPVRERIATLTADERNTLLANVARWRAMSADERAALRERWRRFREHPAEP